jgi:choline dehydrogenase-like flavoprotein
MALVTIDSLRGPYDAIVIGSGAGGGQAAYTLTMDGARVLLLEAGRNYDPRTETPMFNTAEQAPLRGSATPDKNFGFYDATVDGGWSVPGEPYTNAEGAEERQFKWWRARMLGGRTNHWGRISLRNGPYDFRPRGRDGLGFDWPISYEDVAPYYDKVEMLIGVHGTREGMENTPDSPEGILLPPPKARIGELLARQRGRGIGVPVIPVHRAVLTRPLDWVSLPARLHPGNPKAQRILAEDMQNRAACFWATDCGRGCAIRANYQSTTVHLPPAMATGNLDILAHAMAREITVDPLSGKATGVAFIDKVSGMEHRVGARVVILAASAAETARILLNSKSRLFPSGLGNSSGLVGKYIMDTVGADVGGQIPLLENQPPHNEDGAGGLHVYTPWWLYKEQAAGKLGFPRGYHVEFGGGRSMPVGFMRDFVEPEGRVGYGARLKEDARRYYGSFFGFTGRGEMIPNEDCYCELDPKVVDTWGIPVLRFHWKWSEHELRQVAHMQRTFSDWISAMGGTCEPLEKEPLRAIRQGGSIIHEVGGALMGDKPSQSVTNCWSQTWDSKNVFIADGAVFPSNADKNPTLTIMALAWRTADRILDQMRKGNL